MILTYIQAYSKWGQPICKNHPFVDGNKRTGSATAFTFLELNEVDLIFSKELVVEIALQVATSQLSKEGLAKWIKDLTVV